MELKKLRARAGLAVMSWVTHRSIEEMRREVDLDNFRQAVNGTLPNQCWEICDGRRCDACGFNFDRVLGFELAEKIDAPALGAVLLCMNCSALRLLPMEGGPPRPLTLVEHAIVLRNTDVPTALGLIHDRDRPGHRRRNADAFTAIAVIAVIYEGGQLDHALREPFGFTKGYYSEN